MKITFRTLLESKNTLLELGNRKNLTGALALKLKRIIKEVNPKFIEIDESRNDLIIKYGSISNETGEPEIDKKDFEARKQFQKEYKELLEVEMELNVIPIPVNEFPEGISALDFLAIDWMTIEEIEPIEKKERQRHKSKDK